MIDLPPLVDKALADAGYDVVRDAGDGWALASVSGTDDASIMVRPAAQGAVLAVAVPGTIARIGLEATEARPATMHDAGLARTPRGSIAPDTTVAADDRHAPRGPSICRG